MRTDLQLREAILRELGWDARVRETDVDVEVSAGVVALTGTVGSWAERVVAVQQAAHRVAGVLDVVNDVEVRLPGGSARTDTELAHAVRHALQWDALVPDRRIESTVSHGAVTIAGEVDFAAQREDAEQAIRNLTGVRHLVNKIRVEPVDLASAEYVKKSIEDALTRRLARELSHINVEVRESLRTSGLASLCGCLLSGAPLWLDAQLVLHAVHSGSRRGGTDGCPTLRP